ncbi:hypothetical protein [Bradyrhizobium sp. BTAi1]|uniref:hypothetical protein n=1 Tax=Bradyrhizobium sp. (strain BTAi1 / ATCC BAA-1182) TaxID=288000 RepID=UPI0011D12A90|nr:hypothetical protein [Bradyrhizobium sp. BTAi1]
MAGDADEIAEQRHNLDAILELRERVESTDRGADDQRVGVRITGEEAEAAAARRDIDAHAEGAVLRDHLPRRRRNRLPLRQFLTHGPLHEFFDVDFRFHGGLPPGDRAEFQKCSDVGRCREIFDPTHLFFSFFIS